MRYLMQAFLCLTIVGICLSPTDIRAFDDVKVTYQTATLSENVQTVTIDTRVERLHTYLKSKNSSMTDAALQFVKEADRLGLDWKLVAAIAGNESYFGALIPYNSYNGWGWGVWTGTNDGMHFDTWEHGVTIVSEGLKENYVSQGLTTVEQIGQKYAADPGWAWKVQHFMDEIEAFDPYAQNPSHVLALSL